MKNYDLEEYGPKKTKIRAVVHYNSGRTEIIVDKLKTNGEPPKRYVEKIKALRSFPTVRKVEEQKL